MGVYAKKAGAWQQIGVDPATAAYWAQVTGGTVTEYTKPDGSVMEVHTFTAAGSLTVVRAGYAECLVVAGGGGNWNGQMDGGGRVVDGLRALPAGALAVVVGAGGATNATANTAMGQASSLGVLTAGRPGFWAGAGATVADTKLGYVSSITGTAVEYAKGQQVGAARANMGDGGATGSAGIVIVAVQKTPPTVSTIVASGGTITTFVGDGVNGVLGQTYKEHEFIASGTLTVTVGGTAEVLVVGPGGYGGSGNREPGGNGGGGGGVEIQPILLTPGAAAIHVGISVAPSPAATTVGDSSWIHDASGAMCLALGGGRGGDQAGAGGGGGSGGGTNGPANIPQQGIAGNANRGGSGAGGAAQASVAGVGKFVWGKWYGGGGGWYGGPPHANGGGANGAGYEGSPGAAVPNSGGGGGGGFYGAGAGATGVVRVRYPVAA